MPKFLTVATAVVVGFTSTGCFSAQAAKPTMEQMSDFTSCVSTAMLEEFSVRAVVTDDIRESCRKKASIDRGVDIYDELTECSTFNASPNDLSVEAIAGDSTAIMCELSLGMYEHGKYH